MMDTSETYVKMCEKAVEIQENKVNPFHYAESNNEIFVDPWKDEVWAYRGFITSRPKRIWLPRQDQLQEMVKTDDIILDCSKFFSFVAFYTCERVMLDQVEKQILTMEQLWLAFVMSALHLKTWNGEDWVTQASL